MSQDQEPVGAEPPSLESTEGSEEAPMNTLEASESEVEEVKEQTEDIIFEEPVEEESQPSNQDRRVEGDEDSDEDTHPMDALLEEESYDLEMPRRGEIRVGTIARVTEMDILVDIGAKSEGVISSRELERLSDEQRNEMVVGKQVDVYVLQSGGRDGQLVLSMSKAREERDWQQAETLLKSQDLFEGTVAGYNKGGLIIKLGNVRGFIPASQVSLSRRRRAHGNTPDQRWGKMVDEPVIAKVIEVDRSRNRLIMSERAATREARNALKERLIDDLEPGEVRIGHVISLADFGAFVDIGGADGLVHLSEISWKRVTHPREILKVGQKVDVKVLGVDKERKRISLSIRELEANPWDQVVENFEEGQLVEGKVTKLTDFGAFASLAGTGEYDIEGLIHVSELADRRVEHPREVVQEGQVITLRIIKIDNNRRRIGLSMKRVSSAEYSEQDWRVAMQDIQASDSADAGSGEVEDFDAALEAAVEDIPGGEDELEADAVSEEPTEDKVVEEAPVDELPEPEIEISEEAQTQTGATLVSEEPTEDEVVEETPVDELPEPEIEISEEAQTQNGATAVSEEPTEDEVVEEAPVDELPEPEIEISAEAQTQNGATAVSEDPIEDEVVDEAPVDELPEPEIEISEEEQIQAEATESSIDEQVEVEEESEVEVSDGEEMAVSEEIEREDEDKRAEVEGADPGGEPPTDDPKGEAVETK